MKVLVVSDVHANIAALNTILEKEADYDILCCAGDYTDYGIYPAKMPPYETAFVFMKEDYQDIDVPPWAIKLILGDEDLKGTEIL